MRRSLVAAAIVAALSFAASLEAQNLHNWDAGNYGQPGQLTMFGNLTFGGTIGVPLDFGDFDDDGFLDFAVAPMYATGGPALNRTQSGEVTVFRGNGVISGQINMSSLPAGQPMLTVHGGASFDYAGTEIWASDVTGDGIDDLLIGVTGDDPNGRNLSGSVFLIPGGAGFGGTIDLASPPSSIVWFQGKDANDRIGLWVEAGDVNGDGIDDIMISADDGDGLTNTNADRGEVYVIYGGQTLPSVIDLANPPMGLNMVTIYGVDNNDHLGTCIHSVDLDVDGYEEIIIAAAINRAGAGPTGQAIVGGDGPGNSRNRCGDNYIIWGSPTLPSVINLASPPATVAASLTVIYGADADDVLGEELSSGNFDGDAYPDLLLGALTADGINDNQSFAGEAVVIYGGPQLRGQTIDFANPPAGTVVIYGAEAGDIFGDTLSAGDINKDGFDDLIIGIPTADGIGNMKADSGEVVVYWGGPVRWPASMQVAVPSTRQPWRYMYGAEPGDIFSYSMEAGDYDNDGFADIFPNHMAADGFNNGNIDASDVSITSGRMFSIGLVTLGTSPKINSTIMFNIRAEPNLTYFGAMSLGLAPGTTVPGVGTINLVSDFVLAESLNPGSLFFSGMTGVLDFEGKGSFAMNAPNIPALAGFELFTAFVTYDPMALMFKTISDTTSFALEL